MPTGPGKYDDLCTEIREKTEAKGVILIVFNGNKGQGFSCQLPPMLHLMVPDLLRGMANEIEKEMQG